MNNIPIVTISTFCKTVLSRSDEETIVVITAKLCKAIVVKI